MRNKRPFLSLCIVGALAVAGVAWPQYSAAQTPRAAAQAELPPVVAQLEKSLTEAITRGEPSVVAIGRTSAREPALIQRTDAFGDLRIAAPAAEAATIVGTGVIIDSAGFVLTQYLAVREGDQHTVTTSERVTYPATIRAADPRSGLAVLAMDRRGGKPAVGAAAKPATEKLPAIRFGDASKLRKGTFVIAIGNPFAIASDGQATASWGIVTNLAQKAPANTNLNNAPGAATDYRTTLHHLGTLIQTDARLGWSTGGGALVNLEGELMGLTTTAATIAGHEQPAGYAIPINAAFRRIIDTLKEGREVEYGMLGVSFGQQLFETPAARGSRLALTQVFPGSPAAHAGLQAGDAVTRIGDQPVADVDEVQLAVGVLPPATATKVEYIRNGSAASTQLTLAKLAVSGKKIVTVEPERWRGMRVDFATALEAAELTQAIASGAFDPDGCVLVADVEEDSTAWRAGVRHGMFISHVGGERVTSPAEFQAAARNLGEKFDIRLTKPVSPLDDDPAIKAGAPQ